MKIEYKSLQKVKWDEVYHCDIIEDVETGKYIHVINFIKRLENLKTEEFTCNPGFDPLALLLDEEPKKRPEVRLSEIRNI